MSGASSSRRRGGLPRVSRNGARRESAALAANSSRSPCTSRPAPRQPTSPPARMDHRGVARPCCRSGGHRLDPPPEGAEDPSRVTLVRPLARDDEATADAVRRALTTILHARRQAQLASAASSLRCRGGYKARPTSAAGCRGARPGLPPEFESFNGLDAIASQSCRRAGLRRAALLSVSASRDGAPSSPARVGRPRLGSRPAPRAPPTLRASRFDVAPCAGIAAWRGSGRKARAILTRAFVQPSRLP